MLPLVMSGLAVYGFLWGVMFLGNWIDGTFGQIVFWLGFALATYTILMITRHLKTFLVDTSVGILHQMNIKMREGTDE